MIHFKGNDFEVATATAVDEAKEATRAGFEFANKNKGARIYKKQGSPTYKDKLRNNEYKLLYIPNGDISRKPLFFSFS